MDGILNNGLSLADQLQNALNHFDYYRPTPFEKAIKSEFESNCHWPYNVVEEEDGSITYEVAVIGKTKDDVSVTSEETETLPMLVIEVKDEKSDKKRKYIEERIKSGHLRLEISVETKYDLSQIKPKVQNGLLTVNVPLAKIPEPKVTKYTVE
jgi:HSP20 family molecular chaperone IbpA